MHNLKIIELSIILSLWSIDISQDHSRSTWINQDQPRSTNINHVIPKSANIIQKKQEKPRLTKEAFCELCLSLSYFPHTNPNEPPGHGFWSPHSSLCLLVLVDCWCKNHVVAVSQSTSHRDWDKKFSHIQNIVVSSVHLRRVKRKAV